ncbi:MAG: hypothetical protein AB4290_19810 [Spirulina sp.]
MKIVVLFSSFIDCTPTNRKIAIAIIAIIEYQASPPTIGDRISWGSLRLWSIVRVDRHESETLESV